MVHNDRIDTLPGRVNPDIENVTTLPELYDILQMLRLPGPPHWLTTDHGAIRSPDMAFTPIMKAVVTSGR